MRQTPPVSVPTSAGLLTPAIAALEPAALSSLPLGAAGGGAELPALQHFRALMAAQGHTVQVARMCFDRLYAYERIALAHAGNDEELRALALQLFHACHYGDPTNRALS